MKRAHANGSVTVIGITWIVNQIPILKCSNYENTRDWMPLKKKNCKLHAVYIALFRLVREAL